MLTPRDIHEAEFKRVWKGYSPDEVDTFLGRVLTAYESVFQDNVALREEIKQLEERLKEATQKEGIVSETLAMAKQAADDAKQAARRDAEAMVQAAQGEAERIKAAAQRQREEDETASRQLQRQLVRLRTGVEQAMAQFVLALESYDVDDIGDASEPPGETDDIGSDATRQFSRLDDVSGDALDDGGESSADVPTAYEETG